MHDDESHIPRPSIADIARKLEVSGATVSLALRNSSRISLKTRERVQAAARELGYSPDPEVGKLMHKLRSKRPANFKSTICALTNIPKPQRPECLKSLIDGATKRAGELGFGFEVIQINLEGSKSALQKSLSHRGIEGVLLLPLNSPPLRADWLKWQDYSVVSVSRGILEPDFDCVVDHCFGNVTTCLKRLSGLGYRRIGLVYNAVYNQLNNEKVSAALASYQNLLLGQPIHPFVYSAPICLATTDFPLSPPCQCPKRSKERFSKWLEDEQPDAILFDTESTARAICSAVGLGIPGEIGLATTKRSPESEFSGTSESPEERGIYAINALNHKILANQKGPSSRPKTTMVRGSWTTTASVTPRRPTGRIDGHCFPFAACRNCPSVVHRTPGFPDCLKADLCPIERHLREPAMR